MDLPNGPGHLALLRAPGFMRADVRPFHHLQRVCQAVDAAPHTGRTVSEALDRWAQLDLPGPGATRLLEGGKVGSGDRVGIRLALGGTERSDRPLSRTTPSTSDGGSGEPIHLGAGR